jgi:hypothetical protein
MKQMPVRLSTTVSKIASLSNSTNAALMTEFYHYMKNNGASESHTNNSLKTNMETLAFSSHFSQPEKIVKIALKKKL